MVFTNSENATAIVKGAIHATEVIALESYSNMAKTRRGEESSSPFMEAGTFQEFSAKINDVFDSLQNIDMDEAEVTTFLKEIGRTPKNLYEDSSVVFVNPDNVGRINATYILDYAKDIAATADRIIRGDITTLTGTNVSTPVVEGIKKQIVSGTYKGNTSKSCFGEIPKGIPYPYDSSFISTMAIPFIKTFASKKAEIAAEITALQRASESAFATVSTISQSKDIALADTNARQLLNLYLGAASTAIVDIVSFASYLIIRKMDIMIANATALNEMCDNVRSNGLIRLAAESAQDEESPAYGIDNTDMLLGVIRGVYGKVKYNVMNYYGETSHPLTEDMLVDIQDKYSQVVYPVETFVDILNEKGEAIEKFGDMMRTMQYPSPVQFATDLGLYKNMVHAYEDKLSAIGDISAYTNNDSLGHTDKAFASLAEIHDMEKIVEKIRMRGNDISAALERLKMIANDPTKMMSNSDAVRNELVEVIEIIDTNINKELIPEILSHMDKRCVSLDTYIDAILDSTTTVVPDISYADDDVDYVESALMSDIQDEEILANIQITEAAREFQRASNKKITFVATEAEAPAANGGGTPAAPASTDTSATPAPASTPTAAPAANGGDKKVEVTEDQTKQTEADATQNADAAAATTKDPQAFKDMMKKIMDQAMTFFENMISNFSNVVKSKKNADGSQFITENKDAILNRSFNGITLKIPFYPDLDTAAVVKEIGQVTAAVGALNAQSIKSSDEDKLATLLFPFADFGSATTAEDRVRIVKEKYTGQQGAVKEEYTGAKLRTKTQQMMAFCEEYYVDKKGIDVANALQTLKGTTKNMMTGLASISDPNGLPEDAKVKFINRSVKMFAGAITTAYRNKANSYYSALRSLKPKVRNTQAAAPAEPATETPPVEAQPAEQPAAPEVTPTA